MAYRWDTDAGYVLPRRGLKIPHFPPFQPDPAMTMAFVKGDSITSPFSERFYFKRKLSDATA
jgi:hypothetical protein